MKTIALRFVKWGTGLLVLGLLTGYGPLGHYLHGGVKIACPWAPVHGHVALLGWLGMTVFGLVYHALPDWGTPSASATKLAKGHFWLAVIGVLGVWANGILGYRLIGKISPGFYYKPDTPRLNLWLSIDGWFLSLFAIGCVLFMLVVFGTRFVTEDREP